MACSLLLYSPGLITHDYPRFGLGACTLEAHRHEYSGPQLSYPIMKREEFQKTLNVKEDVLTAEVRSCHCILELGTLVLRRAIRGSGRRRQSRGSDMNTFEV